jgi:hypothetical protein
MEPQKVKERRQQLEDVRWILSTKSGRRFFWRYIGDCGVFRSSFTGSSDTFFKEGMRIVGLNLLSDINDADPKAYALMMSENSEGDTNNVRS